MDQDVASPRVVPGDGLATLFIITNPCPLPMCLHRCISSSQAYCDWLWSLVRSKRTSWGPQGVGEGARAGVGWGLATAYPSEQHLHRTRQRQAGRTLPPKSEPGTPASTVQGQEDNHTCGPLWSPCSGSQDSGQSELLWTNPTYYPGVHSGMFPRGAYRC